MAKRTKDPDKNEKRRDANPDPISGEPGAHPVGVGVGAGAGGLGAGAAAGAVVGSVAGPVGTAVGAAIGTAAGAIAGGLAGKAVAERLDPTVEDAYWKDEYAKRPYVQQGESYATYQPAYQYGWEASDRFRNRSWDQIEPELERDWNRDRSRPLTWDRARLASRDAYERISNRPGPGERLH